MTADGQESGATWQGPKKSGQENYQGFSPPMEHDNGLLEEEVPPEEPLHPVPLPPDAGGDELAPETEPLTLKEQIGKYLSLIAAPLLFAALTCLIVLPQVASHRAQLPAEGFWPITLVILAVALAQAVFIYYAGSDKGMWALGTLGGFCLFLLITVASLFGLLPGLFLLLACAIGALILARFYVKAVPEGYVDIVSASGKYSRTLFPGLNVLLPWEKDEQRLKVSETQWACPPQRIQMSRDEELIARAIVSYQLMPDDAYLAVKNWEEHLREQFITMLQTQVRSLSPDDFIAWPRSMRARTTTMMGNGAQDAAVRFERINKELERQLSERVAPWGVEIKTVMLRDVVLAPLGAASSDADTSASTRPGINPTSPTSPRITEPSITVASARQQTPAQPKEGSKATAAQVADAGEKTQIMPNMVATAAGAVPAGATTNSSASTSASTPAAAPAPSTPRPLNEELLVKAYKEVQSGKITDPDTIISIAEKFEAVARDPQLNEQVSFDAARAALNLRNQAKTCAEQYSAGTPYNDETKPNWTMRRASDENLMGGG